MSKPRHRVAKRTQQGNFAPSFSFKFVSIFVHISGSSDPITVIWVSTHDHWKDLSLLQNLSTSDVNFGQR